MRDGPHPVYSTRRWKALRARVFGEEPYCRAHLAVGEQVRTGIVDHIVPIKAGGPKWERSNLQGLCRSCHQVKTAAESKPARELRKQIQQRHQSPCCDHGYNPDHCPRCGGNPQR